MKTQVIQVRHPINPCAFDEPGSALREGQGHFDRNGLWTWRSRSLPEAVLLIFRWKEG